MTETQTTRETNALTIMPLPVRIPASWYDLLPKVLPLIKQTTERTECYMADETIQIFLNKWNKALIRREGAFVWLNLGGVACYEILPDFVKSIRERIIGREKEIKVKYGTKGVLQHWRSCIKELNERDDAAVLKIRGVTLRLLQPEMWHDGLGRAWSFAAERANVNFSKIRPVVQKWISRHEGSDMLDKPFAGRLTGAARPLN
jgi:hypothetical protein